MGKLSGRILGTFLYGRFMRRGHRQGKRSKVKMEGEWGKGGSCRTHGLTLSSGHVGVRIAPRNCGKRGATKERKEKGLPMSRPMKTQFW